MTSPKRTRPSKLIGCFWKRFVLCVTILLSSTAFTTGCGDDAGTNIAAERPATAAHLDLVSEANKLHRRSLGVVNANDVGPLLAAFPTAVEDRAYSIIIAKFGWRELKRSRFAALGALNGEAGTVDASDLESRVLLDNPTTGYWLVAVPIVMTSTEDPPKDAWAPTEATTEFGLNSSDKRPPQYLVVTAWSIDANAITKNKLRPYTGSNGNAVEAIIVAARRSARFKGVKSTWDQVEVLANAIGLDGQTVKKRLLAEFGWLDLAHPPDEIEPQGTASAKELDTSSLAAEAKRLSGDDASEGRPKPSTSTPQPDTSASQYAPSFDCQKASSWVEISICANSTLSALDSEMARLYESLRTIQYQSDLVDSQRGWIAARETCRLHGTPIDCLSKEFETRIAWLKARANTVQKNQVARDAVRAIDWKNRAYRASDFDIGVAGITSIRFKDGEWPGVPDAADAIYVHDVEYADLTGDGIEEALVSFEIGRFLAACVYDHAGEVLGRFSPDGMVAAAPQVILTANAIRAEQDPECCPSRYSVEKWDWDAKGRVFRESGPPVELSAQAIEQQGLARAIDAAHRTEAKRDVSSPPNENPPTPTEPPKLDTDGSDCDARPEVRAYMSQLKERTLQRWSPPPDAPGGTAQATIRWQLDVSGSASSVELVSARDSEIGATVVDALRSASPFPPMNERVRCLAGRKVTGTFSLQVSAWEEDDQRPREEHARESQRAAAAEEERIRAQREHYNSEACFQKRLCANRCGIRHIELALARERQIGEVSGYVDATKMNGYGRSIVALTEVQNNELSAYESNFGGPFDQSVCSECINSDPTAVHPIRNPYLSESCP